MENRPAIPGVHLSPFRKLFWQLFIPQLLALGLSFAVVQFNPYNFPYFVIRHLSVPIMAMLAVLAFGHSWYQKRLLKKLNLVEDWDEKLAGYQRIYRFRLFWYLFSCWICCGLYILAPHRLFFIFALIDTLLQLSNYPNESIFKRELEEEEIIFY